jgi:hypothetical protein
LQIGLLNNLRAGSSRDQVSRLLALLSAYPDVLHVETDDVAALPDALADLARREVDLLVVNGGDGTLQHALTEILEHGAFDGRIPRIAVLRGGRTNMTALDIGSRRNPVKALRGLIEATRAGELDARLQPRHVLRIQYDAGRNVRNGMFLGLGVIPRAIDFIQSTFPAGRTQGVSGSTLVTAGLVGRLVLGRNSGISAPDKMQIMVGDEPLAGGEYGLVMASSLHRLFAGMRPFWGKEEGGVQFTAIRSDIKPTLQSVPGILRGRPNAFVTPERGASSLNAKRIEIKLDCGLTVDGEQIAPETGRIVSITADSIVRFVRS